MGMQTTRLLTTCAATLAAILHVSLGRLQVDSLSEALGKATFYHNGTAHASDGEFALRLKSLS